MYENQSAIVVEMAKKAMDTALKIDPTWKKLFYRFYCDTSESGANASYVNESSVLLIGALKHNDFYTKMNEKSAQLLKALNKDRGTMLLIVDSDFNYDIKFDFEKIDRWLITKLNGASGIPEGLENA